MKSELVSFKGVKEGVYINIKGQDLKSVVSELDIKLKDIESFNLISFDLRRDNRSIYFGHVSFANKGLTNAMPSYFEVEPGNVLKVSLFKPMEIEMFKNLDIVELENADISTEQVTRVEVIDNTGRAYVN